MSTFYGKPISQEKKNMGMSKKAIKTISKIVLAGTIMATGTPTVKAEAWGNSRYNDYYRDYYNDYYNDYYTRLDNEITKLQRQAHDIPYEIRGLIKDISYEEDKIANIEADIKYYNRVKAKNPSQRKECDNKINELKMKIEDYKHNITSIQQDIERSVYELETIYNECLNLYNSGAYQHPQFAKQNKQLWDKLVDIADIIRQTKRDISMRKTSFFYRFFIRSRSCQICSKSTRSH